MPNIQTKADARIVQRAADREAHKGCPSRLFSHDAKRGDIGVCRHGVILEYRSQVFYSIIVREITPLKHPFLYAKAKKIIALEERLRQEERDSDGGS